MQVFYLQLNGRPTQALFVERLFNQYCHCINGSTNVIDFIFQKKGGAKPVEFEKLPKFLVSLAFKAVAK